MAPAIRRVRSDWQGAILVCGKCSRKVGGGFGRKGRTPLAKALRKAMGWGKRRTAAGGVVETRCLGVCPRRAVTLIDARRPDAWLVVPAGSDVADLVDRLADRVAGPVSPPAAPHPDAAALRSGEPVRSAAIAD